MLVNNDPVFSCLHPWHNESPGCGNPQCFKYRSGSHEAYRSVMPGPHLDRQDFERLYRMNQAASPAAWRYGVADITYPVTLRPDGSILDATGKVVTDLLGGTLGRRW